MAEATEWHRGRLANRTPPHRLPVDPDSWRGLTAVSVGCSP